MPILNKTTTAFCILVSMLLILAPKDDSTAYAEVIQVAGIDIAILTVFPDYQIETDTPIGKTDLPGHAGVLLINNNGTTKYYEFGRYDSEKKGQVMKRTIPNVEIKNGLPTIASLSKVCNELATTRGRIRGALFKNVSFSAMHDYAEQWFRASNVGNKEYDPKRKEYSITKFNCGHFAEEVILKGNAQIDRPVIINPFPVNIVDEYIEEGNAEILYSPKDKTLTIGKSNEKDAKIKRKK